MKMTLHLSDHLHRRLKIQAAKEGRTVTAIVAELAEGYLLYQEKTARSATVGYVVEESHTEGDVRVVDKVKVTGASAGRPDLSKSAQVKGKMGR